MKRFLVVANWKAHTEFPIYNFQFPNNIEVVIAAPFTMIEKIPLEMRAAQDVSAYPVGAYTGETPAKLLANLGVKYCLVGHSERRKYQHETNIEVEAKMNQAIQNRILPIICAQNLEEIPENIRNFSDDKYLIMYEPFAAISTEGQYHPESVGNIVATLTDWKDKLNLQCRFLYGGSVNPENIEQLVGQQVSELVSGLVIGHASLEVKSFSAIIKKCLQALS